MKKGLFLLATAVLWTGCATYNYADNVKLVSFDDNAKKGVSMGNIHGEDCTWTILGYKMGENPTVSRAFENIRSQAGGAEAAGIDDSSRSKMGPVRYVNNVSTKTGGFNAANIVAKQCIEVTGVGYR